MPIHRAQCFPWRLLLVAMLGMVAAACPAPPALAATGGVTRLPAPKIPKPGPPPKPNPRAMIVTIDTTWVECNGYRPVRINLTTAPLTTDRTITVVFKPMIGRGGQHAITVSQDIEVPAGAASATSILSVPQMEPWSTFGFELYDDGEPVEELSVPHTMNFVAPNNLWGDSSSPNILLLGATKDPAPIFASFGRMNESAIQMGLPPSLISGAMPKPKAVANTKFTNVPGIMSHAELPTRWIDYSGLDVIYVTLPELKDLIEKHPQQWRAMRAWITTGGNLWVADAGVDWQGLPELARLLELPADMQSKTSAEEPLAGWQKPDTSQRQETVTGASQQYGRAVVSPSGMSATVAGDPTAMSETAVAVKPVKPRSTTIPFVTRSLGLGQVVAISESDPLANNEFEWPWVFNTVTSPRWQWYHRHGFSLQRDNHDFWEFLIPGVGLAPVTEFQILITLFVLAIGPLNYFLLRRWHKQNLIVITVPVSALLITGCLLLYAVLADGLGVRVRARSFTAIDQQRGEAVCWARLSYYAGLSPSQGMAFPTDTTIFPLEAQPQGGSYRSNRQTREIDWRDKQYLGRGWLAARTPTQFVTVAARATQRKLDIQGAKSSADEKPQVTNHLGARILKLVLVNKEGRFFETTDLKNGGKALLEATDPLQASSELQRHLGRNAPQGPIDSRSRSYGLFGMRSYYRNYGSDLDEPSLRHSILERQLNEFCGGGASLPPGSYVAIVDASPEVSLGLEGAREEASFHVIYGTW